MAETILTRLSFRDPPDNQNFTPVQEKADLLLYSFQDQLTDPILIASQLAGAGVYSLFRLGTLRLFGPVVNEGITELREAQVARQTAKVLTHEAMTELKEVEVFESLGSGTLKKMKPSIPLGLQKELLKIKTWEGRIAELQAEGVESRRELKAALRAVSSGLPSMLAGSEAFDLTRRSLLSLSGKGSQYPNLWSWKYSRDGMVAGMAQSSVSIGFPLVAGDVVGNLFFVRDLKFAWPVAGAAAFGGYLLFSLLFHPSSKNDVCLDGAGRDVCQ
jgi:hypothetical protein